MKSLWLTMSGTAGTDLLPLCEEIVETSNRLQLNIECDFNGVKLLKHVTDGKTAEGLALGYFIQTCRTRKP